MGFLKHNHKEIETIYKKSFFFEFEAIRENCAIDSVGGDEIVLLNRDYKSEAQKLETLIGLKK